MNDDYGRGIRRISSEEFAREGGEVAEIDPFLESKPDVAAYLDRILKDGGFEFIVVAANITEGASVLRQIRARGIRLPSSAGMGSMESRMKARSPRGSMPPRCTCRLSIPRVTGNS